MTQTPPHAIRQRPAIRALTPGLLVGHANPELATWAGCITANGAGNWVRPGTGDVWVIWYRGDVPPGRDGESRVPSAGWIEASACTIAGYCPRCGRAAHRVLPEAGFGREPGWYHDQADDQAACQGGAVPDPGHACHIGPARLRAYLASRDGIAFTAADVAVHMGWDEADAGGYLRIMAQDRRLGELAEQAGGTWLFRLGGGTRS